MWIKLKKGGEAWDKYRNHRYLIIFISMWFFLSQSKNEFLKGMDLWSRIISSKKK